MEYIEKIFKKTGWISILESVIFAILGAIVIWKPEGTVKAISFILGIIFIIVGIGKMINYFSAKGKYDLYNYDLIYGLMACVLGIVTIVYSNTIGSIFRIIIGIWIIYSSFIRMSLSAKLKALKLNIWIYSLILAIIMFICRVTIAVLGSLLKIFLVLTIAAFKIVFSLIRVVEYN